MFTLLKRHWAILAVFVLCFWAIKPLFAPGFFPIHDDEQIARVFELDSALSDGQFPVRWVSHLGFGYGYPLFNFYPPFSYYMAEVFHMFGFSFIDSAKLVFILGFFLSSLFMYLWVKEHFGKLAGVLAALLYVYAPYHAVNIYVRGSLPDFTAYAFIPAVFWLSDKLFKTKKLNYSILFGILLAIIPLTHILKIVSIFPFISIYLIYLLLRDRKEIKKNLSLLLLSFAVAFGLTAYFLIPAILEKGYTLVDEVNIGELYNYKLHFVYLRQFFNSPWGYGGSIYGLEDGLSFELGKTHILFVFFSLLILSYSFIKKKTSEINKAIIAFLLFLLSVYLTSFYSEWLWSRVKFLSYLQFPWRFLTYAAVFSSFLGGFVIYYVQKKFSSRLALVLFMVAIAMLFYFEASDYQPQKYLNVKDNYYTNLEDIKWRVSKASFEFVPKGIATKLSDIKTTQVDLEQKDIPDKPYKILSGNVKVEVLSDKSHSKIFQIKSKEKSVIQINTFSFPGWETALDGKRVKYNDNNKLKLITVDISEGMHNLSVNFVNTLPRAVGNAITLVTIFNLIGFGLFRLWKR